LFVVSGLLFWIVEIRKLKYEIYRDVTALPALMKIGNCIAYFRVAQLSPPLTRSAPLLDEEGWQRSARSVQKLTGWCYRNYIRTTPALLRGLSPPSKGGELCCFLFAIYFYNYELKKLALIPKRYTLIPEGFDKMKNTK